MLEHFYILDTIMNITELASTFSSDSLNSTLQSGFLKNLSPSSDFMSSLSSLSINQMLLLMGGLMFFRFFGGMIFAVFGLLSLVLTCVTSVVCSVVGVFIKMLASATIPFINVIGSVGSSILSSPAKIISIVISKWGRLLVPVLASGVMSTLFFQSNSLISWILRAGQTSKAEWVSIDRSVGEPQQFEEF